MIKVDDLSIRYGQVAAVRGLSFSVGKGEFLCVVGPNGAGKSSTTLAIGGAIKPSAGTIVYDGKSIVGCSPENIARMGVSIVPEGRHVFASLTVRENLALGSTACGGPAKSADVLRRVLELFPILRDRFDGNAGKLSGGEQQMLVIGRALMAQPRLLIIDEPSLGLAPKIVDLVYRSLSIMRREFDLTLIVVEQSLERALAAADRILIMRSGLQVLEGLCAEFKQSEEIREAYFGFRD